MSLGGGDPQVVLRRIRHGFIICDDTELCDKIISQDVENEQRRRTIAKSKMIDIDKTDLLSLLRNDPDYILDELSHSPEWTASNVQVRRVRCETLGRLDEIKTENEAKRKVQIISWQNPSNAQTIRQNSDESGDDDQRERSASSLFQRRSEPIFPLVQKSPLTALIRSTGNNVNPFLSYANFDGSTNVGPKPSKKVIVHFPFNKEKLKVNIAPQATVEDAIGFICYQYTAENLQPVLQVKEPSKYILYIADDDGEAEEDFPALLHGNSFNSYDFPHLSLFLPKDFSSAPFSSSSSESVPLKPSDDEGSLIDSSRSVTPSPKENRKSFDSSQKSTTQSASAALPVVEPTIDENDPINQRYLAFESLNLKSYIVDYYIKPGQNKHVQVQIDVSGEQIRLKLLERTSKLSWQQMSLTTQRLVDCTLINKDSSGSKKDRARLYLKFEVQQESDGARVFQNFEFESTLEQGEQFHDQILNIIKLRHPQSRDVYEQQQQQHDQQTQRSSFTKKKRSFLGLIGGISGSGSSAKS